MKRSILFVVLLGISTPSHAWWGQETLTGLWNSAKSAVTSVTSYVQEVFAKPTENKGALAVGAATIAAALIGGGAFAYWWNKSKNDNNNNGSGTGNGQYSSNSQNRNASNSASGSYKYKITPSRVDSIISSVENDLDSASSSISDDDSNTDDDNNNSSGTDNDSNNGNSNQNIFSVPNQSLTTQDNTNSCASSSNQNNNSSSSSSDINLNSLRPMEKNNKIQKKNTVVQFPRSTQQKFNDDCLFLSDLALQQIEKDDAVKEQERKKEQQVKVEVGGILNDIITKVGIKVRQANNASSSSLNNKVNKTIIAPVAQLKKEEAQVKQILIQTQKAGKRLGVQRKARSIINHIIDKAIPIDKTNVSSSSSSDSDFTTGAMQDSIIDRNMSLFVAIQNKNNLPTWNELSKKFVAADRRYQIHFILSLFGLKDTQEVEANISEILPHIKNLKKSELAARAKEFYQQYRQQYQPQEKSSPSVLGSFVVIADKRVDALNDALFILDKGGAATEWYAFDGYKQSQIKFMMRRFRPAGVKDSRQLEKGVLLSVHGTFVNAANFGSDLSKKAGVALLEAVQRLADAKNIEIDMIIPEWSGDFDDQHRREIAPLAQKLMMAWYKKQMEEKRQLAFIDMLGHSEGNSVIKLVIENTKDADVRKLIRWYSVCPTAGSDYVPLGTRMRLCIWSPEDALAFIASITRGRVYRKQDNNIGQYNGLCVNMCLRHNGKFTNHVTSKLPAFAHYDTLFDVAEKFKGHCELSVDINDKNKRILASIRRNKDCPIANLSEKRALYLDAISTKNEEFFVEQYAHIKNASQWHEKPHTVAGFIIKFFKHGYYEKVAGDAEDLIEAKSLTGEQKKLLAKLVRKEGCGWQTHLSISSPSLEQKPISYECANKFYKKNNQQLTYASKHQNNYASSSSK